MVEDLTLIVGLGDTGLSCVRFLTRRGLPVEVADTRAQPPGLARLRREWPAVPVHLGGFDARTLRRFERVVVSPGVALDHPALRSAADAGIELIGDVELFARHVTAPVIAITGSNGKSTVTTLVANMLKRAGHAVLSGANLGPPALDLLDRSTPDYFVLELSSFQLETLASLRPAVAAVLNVSPDHLDRYASAADYTAAKTRIYAGARHAVFNCDDPATASGIGADTQRHGFALGAPQPGGAGVLEHAGQPWLALDGQRIIAVDEIALQGQHNIANALAALAVIGALGVDSAVAADELRGFAGLAHRMQPVAERGSVRWINDSKGTNVGATVAALGGLGAPVVLIAGGEGKGADFAPLGAAIAEHARAVVLIGRDAPLIRASIHEVAVHEAADMDQAVRLADRLARPGDCVLLSPACASFDMFDNYGARGEAFIASVRALGS